VELTDGQVDEGGRLPPEPLQPGAMKISEMQIRFHFLTTFQYVALQPFYICNGIVIGIRKIISKCHVE